MFETFETFKTFETFSSGNESRVQLYHSYIPMIF